MLPHCNHPLWANKMTTIKLSGRVDEKHQLSADVPVSVPPGPVTVLIIPVTEEDDAGDAWMEGITEAWADDLNGPDQDIYTLADGEPVRES